MEKNTYLQCHIRNEPIQTGILRILGISRDEAKDVSAYWSIVEAKTKKKVYDPEHLVKIKFQYKDMRERVAIPESYGSVSFPIVVTNKCTKLVNIFDLQGLGR